MDNDNKIEPIEVNSPFEPGDPSAPIALAPEFGDPETLWNSRQWLQKALEAQGATVEGAGIGYGQADIDINVEGMRYNVSIRPRITRTPA